MSAKITLNEEQEQAFKAIKKFLEHPAANTFILKGYAGTGKTFLMQHLGKWLEENNLSFRMLATTGRAATVLRGKTGFTTKTVHSEVYNFSKVEGIDGPDYKAVKPVDRNINQMLLQFLTRPPDNEDLKVVYIVDEASMLSGHQSADNKFATYGSGVLLDDLFEVAGNNKVIFVGDPCQLPPVRQSISPALDVNWLAQQQRVAISFSLQKIERTDAGNDILKLATAVREMSMKPQLDKLKLPAAGLSNVNLYPSDKELFREYLQRYRTKGTDHTLAIARSNKMVQYINRAVRRELYGSSKKPLQEGDVLLVTQNNYFVPLTNGDMVKVIYLGEFRTSIGYRFQEAIVKAFATGNEYKVMLSLDSMDHAGTDLNDKMQNELLAGFNIRMRDDKIKPNGEVYRKRMREDQFLNSLRVNYGYAVTCHKAQGGEWDDVFLFLEHNMYSMKHPELCKWWYTSITRARKELNLVERWCE
ncbi:AAA family ATPase [Mucilaginibacter daejeonensis]|uniref:ATP-dependent DNA helicase n=1 Tax=Mucilaginibacter daejeonensis TaxID=398049 RepID=UPI001D175FFD|nr:AAA family ATPase [Mucilaginibacter daejeonensis]UEG54445.1 AAA family ATPase [Mucilaginibacter daejeonensis]